MYAQVFVVVIVLLWGEGQAVLLEDVEKQFQTFDECAAHIRAREERRPANVAAFVCAETVRRTRARTTARLAPDFCFDAIGPEDYDMEENRKVFLDCLKGRR